MLGERDRRRRGRTRRGGRTGAGPRGVDVPDRGPACRQASVIAAENRPDRDVGDLADVIDRRDGPAAGHHHVHPGRFSPRVLRNARRADSLISRRARVDDIVPDAARPSDPELEP